MAARRSGGLTDIAVVTTAVSEAEYAGARGLARVPPGQR